MQLFSNDAAAVAGAIRQTAIVREEEPLVVEFYDGGMRRVRVAGNLADVCQIIYHCIYVPKEPL